jgi:hypothetical protein
MALRMQRIVIQLPVQTIPSFQECHHIRMNVPNKRNRATARKSVNNELLRIPLPPCTLHLKRKALQPHATDVYLQRFPPVSRRPLDVLDKLVNLFLIKRDGSVAEWSKRKTPPPLFHFFADDIPKNIDSRNRRSGAAKYPS